MTDIVRDKGLELIYEIDNCLGKLWVLGDIGSDVRKEIMDKLELYRLRAEARNKDLTIAANYDALKTCDMCKAGKMVEVKRVVEDEGSDDEMIVTTMRCGSCGNEEVWHQF